MRPARIVMPEQAKSGDIIELKALIQHPMVTGHTASGPNTEQRYIIHTLTVSYDSEEIFRTDFFSGIAANPYVAFTTLATKTGDLVFTWTDDKGEVTTQTRLLRVV
jgi:sulfur-oxidizing protein SoxZ